MPILRLDRCRRTHFRGECRVTQHPRVSLRPVGNDARRLDIRLESLCQSRIKSEELCDSGGSAGSAFLTAGALGLLLKPVDRILMPEGGVGGSLIAREPEVVIRIGRAGG
ncbi:hypothetical protein [Actinoplanes sp. TFC3]|uniref:hypothetical protein n=1 Tax=Actinoplanes sp. TFC3 TaxID=1710355 RepID=UPI001F41AF5B|nr:hypothetical protein [Actinoplanes sp. TFC3]